MNAKEEKIRIADIKGKGIKKRCRKEEFIYIDALGQTDKEALINLKNKISEEINNYKNYEFDSCIRLYDAFKTSYGENDHIISRPVIMSKVCFEKSNGTMVDFSELKKFF